MAERLPPGGWCPGAGGTLGGALLQQWVVTHSKEAAAAGTDPLAAFQCHLIDKMCGLHASGRQQLNGRYLMTGSFKSFSVILQLYNQDVLWHAGYSCDGCHAFFLQLTK